MEIELLELTNGRCPVQEFLDGLQPKPHKKVLRMLELFDENPRAFMMDPELFSKVSGYEKYKMYEFRILFNKMLYRILACLTNEKCYLVNAFVKKDRKIRQKELNTTATRITTYLLTST